MTMMVRCNTVLLEGAAPTTVERASRRAEMLIHMVATDMASRIVGRAGNETEVSGVDRWCCRGEWTGDIWSSETQSVRGLRVPEAEHPYVGWLEKKSDQRGPVVEGDGRRSVVLQEMSVERD
ncbi:hypothetical protein L6452_34518 [Arctium lappa]|uniref:Uncharacterized protein n=1 Tax=Arctium lappa TaxID=4217 RepID=A0ACB8YID6_ARCLA|nr:hypothetical protein L6452_34518 [Arctium lappa]